MLVGLAFFKAKKCGGLDQHQKIPYYTQDHGKEPSADSASGTRPKAV